MKYTKQHLIGASFFVGLCVVLQGACHGSRSVAGGGGGAPTRRARGTAASEPAGLPSKEVCAQAQGSQGWGLTYIRLPPLHCLAAPSTLLTHYLACACGLWPSVGLCRQLPVACIGTPSGTALHGQGPGPEHALCRRVHIQRLAESCVCWRQAEVLGCPTGCLPLVPQRHCQVQPGLYGQDPRDHTMVYSMSSAGVEETRAGGHARAFGGKPAAVQGGSLLFCRREGCPFSSYALQDEHERGRQHPASSCPGAMLLERLSYLPGDAAPCSAQVARKMVVTAGQMEVVWTEGPSPPFPYRLRAPPCLRKVFLGKGDAGQ